MLNLIKQYKIEINIVLILLLLFLFRHFIITHKDFFEIIFKTLTIIVACLALSTWKKEIKAKKLYEINSAIYSLLTKIQAKIKESEQMNTYRDDDEGDVSSIMCYFFRENKYQLNNLLDDSNRVKQNTQYIKYFCDLAEKYYKKASDSPYFEEKYINPESGEEEYNVDNFENWFWSDYTRYVSEDKYCEFHNEFNKYLKEALNFYNKKISEYYN